MIPKDKIGHFLAGLTVSVGAAVVWALLATWGLAPWAGLGPAVAVAAAVAGLTKEGADWLDNQAAEKAGVITMPHGVDPWDAVATALPGLLFWAATYALGGG